MPSRADNTHALVQRAQLVDRLQSGMPAAMRERAQWLLWRFEPNERNPEGKPLKVPYYVDGGKRYGTQGDEKDRRRLTTFDAAIGRLEKVMRFEGIGFAFLPGDGLIGVDIDGAIDEAAALSDMARLLVECCNSFTELSPSGRGLHIIVSGETAKFKSDDIGLEVYAGGQYFTCTGARWRDTPAEVAPLDPDVLAYMRGLVDEAKARREALRAVQVLPVAPPVEAVAGMQASGLDLPPAPPSEARPDSSPAPAVAPAAASAVGDDFKRVNDAALCALHAWVPSIFPQAKLHAGTGAWRVTSKQLGRDLEEDLSLTPRGITDFGTEQGMTAIDVVVQWLPAAAPKDALHWLAERLGIALPKPAAKRNLQLVSGGAAAAPQPDGDDRPEPPAEAVSDGAEPAKAGRRRSKPPRTPEGGGGVAERLLDHYALLYGTDQVWDGESRMVMAVKNLRLLYGAPLVNQWLAHPARRLLHADQMVFEPGVELPEGSVNLFDGLPIEPMPATDADVQPMLELARHLCSMSADTTTGCAAVLHQLLCWLAYPLQQVGAKMRFSVVFHGPQGTGKNMFFDAARALYGKYGRMVGQAELEDRFNGYLSAKLFLVANEIFTRAELFHGKNKLKAVITDESIAIRGMHQEVRWESNHCNLAFLSNELMPLALEKDDRRHLVVYTPAAEDQALYGRVDAFLRSPDGPRLWLGWLQQYDVGEFHEHTKPLMTKAKASLIELGLRPAERFADEWLDGFLLLPIQVCAAEQLYRVFRRWCDVNGERFPPPQAMFTRTLERHILERIEVDPATGQRAPPRLWYKVVQLKTQAGPRKAMRCWLPSGTGPADGVTEGEWAAASVDAFEEHVARFGRAAAEPDE